MQSNWKAVTETSNFESPSLDLPTSVNLHQQPISFQQIQNAKKSTAVKNNNFQIKNQEVVDNPACPLLHSENTSPKPPLPPDSPPKEPPPPPDYRPPYLPPDSVPTNTTGFTNQCWQPFHPGPWQGYSTSPYDMAYGSQLYQQAYGNIPHLPHQMFTGQSANMFYGRPGNFSNYSYFNPSTDWSNNLHRPPCQPVISNSYQAYSYNSIYSENQQISNAVPFASISESRKPVTNSSELPLVLQEEAEFTEQYSKWKSQYNKWKEENKNHPDKKLYEQYERQWKQYEEQMESRQQDIISRKSNLLKEHNSLLASRVNTAVSNSGSTVAVIDGASAINTTTSVSHNTSHPSITSVSYSIPNSVSASTCVTSSVDSQVSSTDSNRKPVSVDNQARHQEDMRSRPPSVPIHGTQVEMRPAVPQEFVRDNIRFRPNHPIPQESSMHRYPLGTPLQSSQVPFSNPIGSGICKQVDQESYKSEEHLGSHYPGVPAPIPEHLGSHYPGVPAPIPELSTQPPQRESLISHRVDATNRPPSTVTPQPQYSHGRFRAPLTDHQNIRFERPNFNQTTGLFHEHKSDYLQTGEFSIQRLNIYSQNQGRFRNPMPERFHTLAPERFRNQAPERFHNQAPERFHTEAPEIFHNQAPERFHNQTPERFHNQAPERFHNQTPERIVHHNPEESKNFPHSTPEAKFDFETQNNKGGNDKQFRADDDRPGEVTWNSGVRQHDWSDPHKRLHHSDTQSSLYERADSFESELKQNRTSDTYKDDFYNDDNFIDFDDNLHFTQYRHASSQIAADRSQIPNRRGQGRVDKMSPYKSYTSFGSSDNFTHPNKLEPSFINSTSDGNKFDRNAKKPAPMSLLDVQFNAESEKRYAKLMEKNFPSKQDSAVSSDVTNSRHINVTAPGNPGNPNLSFPPCSSNLTKDHVDANHLSILSKEELKKILNTVNSLPCSTGNAVHGAGDHIPNSTNLSSSQPDVADNLEKDFSHQSLPSTLIEDHPDFPFDLETFEREQAANDPDNYPRDQTLEQFHDPYIDRFDPPGFLPHETHPPQYIEDDPLPYHQMHRLRYEDELHERLPHNRMPHLIGPEYEDDLYMTRTIRPSPVYDDYLETNRYRGHTMSAINYRDDRHILQRRRRMMEQFENIEVEQFDYEHRAAAPSEIIEPQVIDYSHGEERSKDGGFRQDSNDKQISDDIETVHKDHPDLKEHLQKLDLLIEKNRHLGRGFEREKSCRSPPMPHRRSNHHRLRHDGRLEDIDGDKRVVERHSLHRNVVHSPHGEHGHSGGARRVEHRGLVVDYDSDDGQPYGDVESQGDRQVVRERRDHSNMPSKTVDILHDILQKPNRLKRPSKICIIIRGVPGSGKTYLAKLIREMEVENGGGAPRMLCLDDYFMVDSDKTIKDSETGKLVKVKVMEYEYEPAMEDTYRQSLFKSFRKTIDNGFFSFVIYDAVNDKVKHFSEIHDYAKKHGFHVYVAETIADINVCASRNTHKRSLSEIQKILCTWQPTPAHYRTLDCRSLLQDAAITEVEMVDEKDDDDGNIPDARESSSVAGDDDESEIPRSKWETLDTSVEKLDKLDGISLGKRKRTPSPQNLEEFLQLDYLDSSRNVPGKKRVRWADIEERKSQVKQREIGFIVGQTAKDWTRMVDDSLADKALKRTKYI